MCSPGWPRTHDPPASASFSKSYRHVPPQLALFILFKIQLRPGCGGYATSKDLGLKKSCQGDQVEERSSILLFIQLVVYSVNTQLVAVDAYFCLKFYLFIFLHVCVSVCMCVTAPTMSLQCPQRPEEGVGFPGTGVTDHFKLPRGS